MNGKPYRIWLQIFLDSNPVLATAAVNSFTQAWNSLAHVLSDGAWTMHSGSSDFLPRAPPMLSVRALQRVWQAHRHNTYMFEGELADK